MPQLNCIDIFLSHFTNISSAMRFFFNRSMKDKQLMIQQLCCSKYISCNKIFQSGLDISMVEPVLRRGQSVFAKGRDIRDLTFSDNAF